ncbi:uncharacterized protein LOC111045461 [Nilaparvata lugens]|uniref:uncharacterized protein LOC111045461 n=1 Tax=Nilaparvata lugens TaxID=108931 RepID=UPI00193E45C3|nr:uncharacterized protein LOC111045461 [Nilaparvata lugens]
MTAVVIGGMEWSKENILEFIDLYKETTVLWDPKDPFHYNKVKKNEAWEDIAREIGRSAEECRKKMEYLLAALRREKMKIKSSLVKGKDHKITWFAFDSLKFLLEERRARKGTEKVPIGDVTFSSMDIDRDLEEDSIVFKHGHDYADSITAKAAPAAASTPAQPPPSKRARADDTNNADLNNSNNSFEITHFANYIATKLASYPPRTRSAVQNAITTLMFVADCGHYDSTGQPPKEKTQKAGARSQTSTPVPTSQTSAASGSRASARITRSGTVATSSQQAEPEVSVSQTQSYQELFDSNNFEDDEPLEKRDMEEAGHQQVEIIVT